MMHLRLIVPPALTDSVSDHLHTDERTTNLVVLRGCAVRPAGDVVECEVTREAASDVLGWLRGRGLYEAGAVALTDVVATPSRSARATEKAAPGAPDDAIVWDAVLDNAYAAARGSWSFYAFLTLAVVILRPDRWSAVVAGRFWRRSSLDYQAESSPQPQAGCFGDGFTRRRELSGLPVVLTRW